MICVSFTHTHYSDPMHSEAKKEIDAKAMGELPSFEKLGEEITAAFNRFGKIFSKN